MSEHSVTLSASGPPETVLEPEPKELLDALAAANTNQDPSARREAVAAVVAAYPMSSSAWAALGALARDPVERYAYFRVGYHRGLDRLRANGWRGIGYVRWRFEGNRGFLRALAGLQRAATDIGEHDEAERCATFIRQLDPDWSPELLGE
ncbi:MAG: DUF3151 domain-containing protein [Acidimicrobiales bacterium]|nr:DUF3151 domain-containing protein [Acidimicrobiales bacterium]